MTKKNLVWAMIGLVSPFLIAYKSRAQSNPTFFSIKECVNYASQNNSNIKIARYDKDYGQKQIKQVMGRALPQANVNGNYQDRLKVPLLVSPAFAALGYGNIRSGYQYNSNLSGEITQMVFDPSFSIGLKAAKENMQLYHQSIQKISIQTAFNIATSYYQVIVLQEQLKLLKTNKSTIEQTLAVTELQFRNGVAKEVDVKRLRVNENSINSQLKQTINSLEQAYNDLKYNMGMSLEQSIALSDTTLTFFKDERVKPEVRVENRIEYKIGRTNLELQQLNIKNNLRGYLPTLTAYANYNFVGQGANFGLYKTEANNWIDYTSSTVGLRVNIPIFDGFQRSAQVQQAKIKTQQQAENVKLIRQNINLEASNSYTQYENTLRRIESERANVDLANEVYQITQLEFEEGVSSSTDLVNSELSLRQAQNTFTKALLDLYVARLNYEKAAGSLMTYLNSK